MLKKNTFIVDDKSMEAKHVSVKFRLTIDLCLWFNSLYVALKKAVMQDWCAFLLESSKYKRGFNCNLL